MSPVRSTDMRFDNLANEAFVSGAATNYRLPEMVNNLLLKLPVGAFGRRVGKPEVDRRQYCASCPDCGPRTFSLKRPYMKVRTTNYCDLTPMT